VSGTEAVLAWTDEQVGIIQKFQEGSSIVVNARAGCLAGDSIVTVNRGGKARTQTIERVHQQLNGGAMMRRVLHGRELCQKSRGWDLSIPTAITRAEGSVGRLGILSHSQDSGIKRTFEIVTESGRRIRATEDHPFFVENSIWEPLAELVPGTKLAVCTGRSEGERKPKNQYLHTRTKFHPYQIRNAEIDDSFKVLKHRLVFESAMNSLTFDEFLRILRNDECSSVQLSYLDPSIHVHHIDEDARNNSLENLQALPIADHLRLHANEGGMNHVLLQIGLEKIDVIKPAGEERTYDLGLIDDPHNFIANGFVVHNCGKTSTVLGCAEGAPQRRGMFMAFNKAIAGDAQAKLATSRANCTASTVHSLAFRAKGFEYQHRLNGPRVTSVDACKALDFNKWVRFGLVNFSPAKLMRVALETVGRFCHSADDAVGGHHVPWIDGIRDAQRDQLVEIVLPLARKAWDDMSSLDGKLRYTHDCYLKIWSMSDPQLSTDYLIFDEAQDSSPVIAHVVAIQENTQLLVVGDPEQEIYTWRGAVNAMDDFDIEDHMPLAQSFRFGAAIAGEANVWLNRIGADPLVRGSDWIDSRVGAVNKPKAVLCRTNAQVFAEVMELQGQGVQPAVVGGVESITSFAEAAAELMKPNSKGTWHHDLQGFKDWDQVKSYVDQDFGGKDLAVFVKLIDRFKPEVIIAVMNNCLPETTAATVVSTAHKAKGREWDTVKIADDFELEPRKDSKGDLKEVPDGEIRLAYVAATRAKLELDASGLYASAGSTT
jgi:hypothetical protein